jgi:hypothetical protein
MDGKENMTLNKRRNSVASLETTTISSPNHRERKLGSLSIKQWFTQSKRAVTPIEDYKNSSMHIDRSDEKDHSRFVWSSVCSVNYNKTLSPSASTINHDNINMHWKKEDFGIDGYKCPNNDNLLIKFKGSTFSKAQFPSYFDELAKKKKFIPSLDAYSNIVDWKNNEKGIKWKKNFR